MCTSTPSYSTPEVAAVTPEAPVAPETSDKSSVDSDTKRRAAASTVLTSGSGANDTAATSGKTLLGQ